MSATFHTADKDNVYPYSFHDIPHLLIIGRYSGATLRKHEIVFKYIFERGQPATREGFVATFAKRAREAAIAAGATPKITGATTISAAAEAEAAFAYAMAMQD